MRVLALLLPVLLAGCSCFRIFEAPFPVEKAGTSSFDRLEATAPVGGTVYSEATYWTKTGHRLQDGFQTSLGPGKVAVTAGDLVFKSNVNGRIAYCTEHPAYQDPSAGPMKSACFIDADNDGRFETVTAAPAGSWLEKEIPQPIRYARTERILPRSDSIRYELLYTGISNDTLRLAYREYLNEMAKPEAALDVSYDFRQKPTTISFRAVKIDVLDADNSQIVYRVLKGF